MGSKRFFFFLVVTKMIIALTAGSYRVGEKKKHIYFIYLFFLTTEINNWC